MMKQRDLAEKGHWDNVYQGSDTGIKTGWRPCSYDALSLEHMLLKEIDQYKPETVLEIGCGNSTWLPYLAKKRNIKVHGMDYSAHGCDLAKKRLDSEMVQGSIFCYDLFKSDAKEIGQYDFVYSLGVVEHFSDLEDVLSHLCKFVRPGGVLLTEVPNMLSVHGIMSWLYQPEQLAKHELINRKRIEKAYNNCGLKNARSKYVGLFSLNIVAWGYNQRFPYVDKFILPFIRKMIWLSDEVMKCTNTFKGIPLLAPFLYAVGIKDV